MMKLVRPRISPIIPSWMCSSVRASTELVASSSTSRAGEASTARAMAISWRWPWLRLAPALGEHGVVAVGQALDAVVRARERRGAPHLLLGGVGPAVEDVVAHGAGEQPAVLQHDPEGAPEARPAVAPHVDAVHEDGARGDLVEPGEQVDDRGLARSRAPHDGRHAAGGRGEGDVAEHGHVAAVAEGHVAELDVPPSERPAPARRAGRGSPPARR